MILFRNEMSNKITIKRSAVPGKIPLPGDLEFGEFAINYADGNLFFKTSSNTIATLASTQFVDVSGNITAVGNISGNYFVGNGSQLTGITATAAPGGNSGAVQFNNAGTTGGSDNFTFDGSNVTVVGNVSGAYFIGNGSQLTGIASSGSELVNGSKTFSLAANGIVSMPTSASFFDANQQYLVDSAHVLDEFDITQYRTAKYIVQATNIDVENSIDQVHSTEVLLTHNGVNTFMTEYATLITSNALITLDSYIANGNAVLEATTLAPDTTVDFFRVTLISGGSVPPLNLEGDLMTETGVEDLQVGVGAEDLNS